MVIFPGSLESQILLTGEAEQAFSGFSEILPEDWEFQRDILDAIESASKKPFTVIGVVMSGGTSGKLSSQLSALRRCSGKSRIILFTPISGELTAREFAACGLADDYFICPVDMREVMEICGTGKSKLLDNIEAKGTAWISELEKLATEDELTGLKNRRYILEFCRQVIEHAAKEHGRVTLLMFDFDNFKHYNDVYGHAAGDEILRQAAVLMRHSCRGHDVVGRIGGDEFVVIFWDEPKVKEHESESERRAAVADHPKEAIFIATRFRKELQKANLPLLGREGKGVLTISGGLASFPRNASGVDELFEQADRALLEAKRSGKNRIYLVGTPDSDIGDIAVL